MNIVLILILLFGVFIKLPYINQPFGGNFASYQEGYASIAKFFLKEHFTDLFHPKLFALIDGTPGLRMLDFPVSSLVAGIGKFIAGGSIEMWGRLQAIAFTAGAALMLYLLVKKLFSQKIALLSSLVFTLSPLSIVYGRSFLNEAGAIFFSIASLYFVLKNQKFSSLMFSGLSLAIAVCMRIQCIALLLPIGFIFYQQRGFKCLLNLKLYFFLIFVLILPIAWFGYTYTVSKSSPNVFMSLFFQASIYLSGKKSLLLSTEFYLRFFDDFTGIVLTPIGFTLFFVGLLLIPISRKDNWLPWTWLLTIALTVLVIPGKYFQHNFYLWHFVPVCSIFIGVAASNLLDGLNSKLKAVALVLFLLIFAGASFRYSLYPAFVIPNSDWNQIKLVREINSLIPPDARIIACYKGSYAFLSYFERLGWPFQIEHENTKYEIPYYASEQMKLLSELEKKKMEMHYSNLISWFEYLREQGAGYFVIADSDEFSNNKSFLKYIDNHYSRVSIKSKMGVLYNIKNPNSNLGAK